MKLRFNIQSPNNTGTPDYTICGQVSSAVALANLALVLKIDGTDIINTADLSAIVFPLAPIITVTNGWTVTASLENVSYIVLDINLTNIWDSTTAEFQISKIGYWSFNKVFEIYGYDLGKNPNLSPVTDNNPAFDLLIINKTNNEVNGIQTKAYASFIQYRKPFTSELHIYKSNSSQGEIIYTDSDLSVLPISIDGFVCVVGNYSVKQTNNLYTYNNTGRYLISTCSTDFLLTTNVVSFPTFGTSTTCVNCDEECIIVDALNTSTTNIDYSLLTQYYVDDLLQNPYTGQVLTLRLIDFTGNILLETVFTFNINPLPYVYDPTLYLFNGWVIPEVGDYIIQSELSVPNLYKCTKNYPIKGCSFYEVKNTDCNEFTVYNRGFSDFSVIVSEMQDDKTFLEISTIVVPALTNTVISHTNDNVYTYTVVTVDQLTGESTTYAYVVVNYCNLRRCLLLGISNLICNTKTECTDCRSKDYYDFNTLIINAHTYFNMLNSEYNFNYIYEALDVNKVNELYELKSFLTRFEEYCVECNKACDCN